jgi:hypothetical protein
VHCARAWSAWPSSLEGRAAGMSADRMTSALPGRLEEIAIVVAGYLCVRACSQYCTMVGLAVSHFLSTPLCEHREERKLHDARCLFPGANHHVNELKSVSGHLSRAGAALTSV